MVKQTLNGKTQMIMIERKRSHKDKLEWYVNADKLAKVENAGRLLSDLSQIGQISNRRQSHFVCFLIVLWFSHDPCSKPGYQQKP